MIDQSCGEFTYIVDKTARVLAFNAARGMSPDALARAQGLKPKYQPVVEKTKMLGSTAGAVPLPKVERLEVVRRLEDAVKPVVDLLPPPPPLPPRKVRVTDIIRTVAEVAGLSESDIVSGSRPHRIAHPRHVAMLLVRQLLPQFSYPKIGAHFGKRDHTTALHGTRAAWARVQAAEISAFWYEEAKKLLAERFPEQVSA